MKSITIHNLDESLETLLRKKAKEEGLSLNKIIQKLLKQGLGLQKNDSDNRKARFMDLSGTWDDEDVKSFNENIKDFEEIHPEDWE